MYSLANGIVQSCLFELKISVKRKDRIDTETTEKANAKLPTNFNLANEKSEKVETIKEPFQLEFPQSLLSFRPGHDC